MRQRKKKKWLVKRIFLFLTKDEYNLFYFYYICCIASTLSFFLNLHNCVGSPEILYPTH